MLDGAERCKPAFDSPSRLDNFSKKESAAFEQRGFDAHEESSGDRFARKKISANRKKSVDE